MTDDERKATETECVEKGIPYIDLNGSELTSYVLFKFAPVDREQTDIDWNGITIVSHPGQKQRLNYALTMTARDLDGLDILKNFWENVKWTVDWAHHPEVIDIYRGNQLVGRVLRASAYFGVQNLPQ